MSRPATRPRAPRVAPLPRWRFHALHGGYTRTVPLVADWEVNFSAVEDDYLPSEISARGMFEIWADEVGRHYPDGLVPILWVVTSPEPHRFKPEFLPFSHHGARHHGYDFLSYYSWPEHAETGAPLSWLCLPVVDKSWSDGDTPNLGTLSAKGGFIQEVTGWKPAILQPHVYLPSLLQSIPASPSEGVSPCPFSLAPLAIPS